MINKLNTYNISDELITRYLFGELSKQEADMIITALKDEDTRKDFLLRKNLLDSAYFKGIEKNIDTPGSLNQLLNRLDNNTQHFVKEKPMVRIQQKILRIAAILVLALGITAIWFLQAPRQTTLVASSVVPNIALPDNSTIWLNEGSELSYPEKFKGRTREIKLVKGEASFAIKSDKNKPFIVNTRDLQVEVLGTEFNVKLNEDDGSTEVSVQSGQIKIDFFSPGDSLQPIILKAGEKCVYNHTNSIIDTTSHANPNSIAWKTGVFIFSKSPLNEALEIISQHFHYHLQIVSSSIKNCFVSATIDASDMNTVLQTLELSGNFKTEIKSDTLVISGSGCKPLIE